MKAIRADGPITLDGRLRESVWKSAEPATDFIQRELIEGEPANENTEIRIAYDDDNLYIGIMCYDSQPDEIVHNELRFDGDIDSDDHVTIVFDTFNDQRTGYIFVVNPNGARYDALIKDVDHKNDDWNGYWDYSRCDNDRRMVCGGNDPVLRHQVS